MKSTSLKHTNNLIIGVILLGSVVVGYGIYRILLTKIFSTSGRYAELSQSIVNASAEEVTFAREEAILQEMQAPIQILNSALVKKDSIDFIKTLESHAEAHKVFLDTPQFITATKKGAAAEATDNVSLQLRALGEFTDLIKFIQGLGHLPFFLSIEKLQISSSGSAGVSRPDQPLSASAIQATLVLKIFTQ